MFNSCSLKNGRQRKSFTQPVLYQCEQTHRCQRMPSKLKEIISHPDRPNTQNLLPQMTELHAPKHLGAPRTPFPVRALFAPGAGSARRSTFPLGINGIASSGTKTAGTMYPGSLCFRKPRRSSVVGRDSRSSDHIGHQLLFSRRLLLSQDDSLPHGRVLAKRRFDFLQFDAEPADLHLVVNATEKFDVSIQAGNGPSRRSYTGALPARC